MRFAAPSVLTPFRNSCQVRWPRWIGSAARLSAARQGPAPGACPAAWWLVGLGHLGQAYSWVLSLLNYEKPSQVRVVLQDTDKTTPANHSTGLLTPAGPNGLHKTRLIAAASTPSDSTLASSSDDSSMDSSSRKPTFMSRWSASTIFRHAGHMWRGLAARRRCRIGQRRQRLLPILLR